MQPTPVGGARARDTDADAHIGAASDADVDAASDADVDAASTDWHNLSPAEGLQFVMARVGRQLRAAWRTDPAAVGVLHELARSGSMRISALAAVLVLDISTTSRHVSALEADGLVARQPDPADRRATLLALTSAGQEYLTSAIAERSAVLRAATATWADDDVAALHTYLNRLADDLGNLDPRRDGL